MERESWREGSRKGGDLRGQGGDQPVGLRGGAVPGRDRFDDAILTEELLERAGGHG